MWNPRQIYTPIQPAAVNGSSQIIYSEILPDIPLQSLIYCYWELKASQPLRKEYHYKVVADGCIDIFFEIGNPRENCVMGFNNKYSEFPLTNSFHYLGVRFFPFIFPQLFKIDTSELRNSVELLENINPQISKFIEWNFQPGQTKNDIKTKCFLTLLKTDTLEPDKRIEKAVQLILHSRGLLRTEKEIDTGLSPRQLLRLFNYYIGDTAKAFSKVIRFQKVLQYGTTEKNRGLNLFEDGDFFDQSHFTKDFENFYGYTPGQILKK